ncbi:MAG: ABC transporter ATP-binding protein, partial [Myxococcales bacterium]
MNQVSSDTGSGQPDGIPLRQLLKLAVRTVPYLKSARADLRRLLKGFLISLPLLLGLLVAGLLAADLFFNRMLRGQPVTPFEARLLSLDPALFVDVGALGVEARRVLRTKLMIYIGVLIAVYTPLIVGGLFYFIRLVQRINQGLRTQMMAQVQAMSMRHHSGSRVGDSIYHAYQDSAMVTGLMAMLVAPILPLLRATWFLFFVLIFDWRLSVALGAMYLIGILFARHQGPFLRAEFRRARELNAALTSRIQETLSGLKVVKAFGSEAFEQRRFEDASEGAFGGAFHARSRLALYRIVAFSLSAVPVMGAYCLLAVYAAEERSLAAGTALAFTGFATWNLGAWNYALGRMRNAGSAAKGLMDMWGLSQDMSVAMERAFSQVDLTPEVQDAEDAVEMPGLEREVRFEDVSFAYQPERPVLSDVSVTAKAGQITALVGPTGSGKSTLVSLLLRLFDPDAGRVAIDDQDIRRFT